MKLFHKLLFILIGLLLPLSDAFAASHLGHIADILFFRNNTLLLQWVSALYWLLVAGLWGVIGLCLCKGGILKNPTRRATFILAVLAGFYWFLLGPVLGAASTVPLIKRIALLFTVDALLLHQWYCFYVKNLPNAFQHLWWAVLSLYLGCLASMLWIAIPML